MKKCLYLCLITIVFFCCRKNGSNQNKFQLQINGSNYSFDSVVTWIDTARGAYLTSIYAANTKSGSHVTVETQSNVKTLIGTYSHLSPQPSDYILVDFSIIIISGQNLYQYTIEGTPFTFTIENSNNGSLQGSFSGSLTALLSQPNPSTTNGSFYIPYKVR